MPKDTRELLAAAEDFKGHAKTADATENAWQYELLPWVAKEVEALLKDSLDKQMLKVQRGQFDDTRLQYAVMRYKPLEQTDKEFLKELIGYYLAWRGDLKNLLKRG